MAEDIDNKSDVVIVGGVACGPKTAATLARRMPDLKITLFQKETELSYGSCGLPYFASGDIPSFTELINTSYGVPRDAAFFQSTKGFDAVTEAEVVSIDRAAKTVTIRTSEGQFDHGYDKLVLATGATPQAAPFEVPDSERVRHFTRPDDARAFRKLAETGQVGSAVIVGGGFIGCELAEAMVSLWGIETTLIEREPHILPYVLDDEMAVLVEAEMRRNDVDLRTSGSVERITLADDGSPVAHIGGCDPVTADFVFLCLGVTPNVSLAQAARLEISPTGGIVVNLRLQTSDADIYAGGDCIQSTNRITGHPMFLPMGSLANRHGRVIAENIAGNETEFPGVLGAFLVKVFDLNVGAVGLSEEAAAKADLKPGAVWGAFADRAEYYPEAKQFSAKMTFAESDLRLYGLQAVGDGDICRRIDVFSTFLSQSAQVDDLLDFEHGYAPPYSEALDPLHHLAGVAIAKQKGLSFVNPSSAQVASLVAEDGDSVQLLDVRETEEAEASPCKLNHPVVSIPLGELRGRLKELDPKNRIVIICRRGPRSYQAALILKNAGFDDVHVIGGGTTMAIGPQSM